MKYVLYILRMHLLFCLFIIVAHDINFRFDGQSSADDMAGVQPYRAITADFCCECLLLFVYV